MEGSLKRPTKTTNQPVAIDRPGCLMGLGGPGLLGPNLIGGEVMATKYVQVYDPDGSILWKGRHGAGKYFQKGQLQVGFDGEGEVQAAAFSEEGRVASNLPELYTVFHEILFELKKINTQLSLVTDEELTGSDIEV